MEWVNYDMLPSKSQGGWGGVGVGCHNCSVSHSEGVPAKLNSQADTRNAQVSRVYQHVRSALFI